MAIPFWKNVNLLIKRLDTTQEPICQNLGISINTLRGWIAKDLLPRADDALKIAQALDTTVEYLFTGEEPNGGIPKDVLVTAWEISRLPTPLRNIVEATLQSCKEQCLASELDKAYGA